MKKKLVNVAPIALIATACTATPSGPAQNRIKADLSFFVESQKCVGTCVVKRQVSQNLSISVPDGAARLLITTCHKEEEIKNPSGNFKYTYIPVQFLENVGSCFMTLQVITRKGNNLFGFVDFVADEELEGRLACNTDPLTKYSGVSFCQSRVGLAQRLSFDSPVSFVAGKSCNEPKTSDNISFEYNTAVDFCVYVFKEDRTGKIHRLTTRGYTDLPIPE